MVLDISLIAENDLLAFAAGRVGAWGIVGSTAVCLGDVGVVESFDRIVVGEVDGCYVDGVGDVGAAVGGEVDFVGG